MLNAHFGSGRSRTAWLWLLPLATLAGGLAPISMAAASAIVAAALAIGLLALGRRTIRLFLVVLSVILIGYAFAGRGFAYLGLPPLYVGEVALVLGLFALVTALPTRRPGLVQMVIIAFMAWGALRTLPYLQTYGLDALRDGATWGYAAFAVVVSLTVTPAHVHRVVRTYGYVAPLFIVWVPILAVLHLAGREWLPLVPGTGVQIPFFKPGDVAVHLAGAAAFLLAGLQAKRGWRELAQPIVWSIWLAGLVVVSALSRAGMLAMATVSSLLLFDRSLQRWGGAALAGLLVVSVVGLTNVELDVGGQRDISVAQLLENVQSVVSDSEDPALAGTRQWREEWWDAIVGYTISGPYFWQGKGFGINLADDDRVQAPDDTLRAPHNAHLNILARTGLPGLGLWLTVQALFSITLIRAARAAARSGQRIAVGIVGWIFVYWLAALVNMTFDVYLEGPQGGIFFWTLMGLGLAVASAIHGGRASELEGPERVPLVMDSSPVLLAPGHGRSVRR